MTLGFWGALLGAVVGGGLVLVISRLRVIGRPQIATRVLPYVRDLPQASRLNPPPVVAVGPTNAWLGVFGPFLKHAADLVERVFGGSTSVQRRLQRAGLDKTVHEFRIEQVLWGLMGFAAAAAFGLIAALGDPTTALRSLVLCAIAFVAGVMLRENHLSGQANRRERAIIHEFPAIAELLALAVAAGESPVAALGRVVRRSGGELSRDLAAVLAEIRTGTPVAEAFDDLARTTGLPVVGRFAQGVAIAMERGTPLADVLHAQAADVRESGRRDLIETAARKEVAMMVPVVFLVMPVTILFAFWPGVIGLNVLA